MIEETLKNVGDKLPNEVMHLCLRIMFSGLYNTKELFSINELSIGYGNIDKVSKDSGISKKELEKFDGDKPLFRIGNGNSLRKMKNKVLIKLIKERR